MKCMGCPNLSINDYTQMKQNYEKLKDYVKVLEENIKLERKINRRLTEKENRFIDYARTHNINYDDLMQG